MFRSRVPLGNLKENDLGAANHVFTYLVPFNCSLMVGNCKKKKYYFEHLQLTGIFLRPIITYYIRKKCSYVLKQN